MSPLEKLRNDIIKRLNQYEDTDEQHMNDIMDIEEKLKQKEEKREKVRQLWNAAKNELIEIDEFIKLKSENK
ncbi:hypothetical protein P4571_08145 [Niallia alba]|uniref:hypothetical protein n=1 Tax=Niallia alba TaxID=2729105 RepID=UPI002E1C1F14|nr:hypothetical protein [Niallia alba]